jgi:hypothetical protein
MILIFHLRLGPASFFFPFRFLTTTFLTYLICSILARYPTNPTLRFKSPKYRVADKSLARPTSRCILCGGQNNSFDASLVIYINSTNIPPIMIINRIYEYQNLLSL